MPENEPPPVFELELGEHGNRLVFKTPEELRQWADQERAKWQWLNEAGSPMTDRITGDLGQFHNQLNNLWNEWTQNRPSAPRQHTALRRRPCRWGSREVEASSCDGGVQGRSWQNALPSSPRFEIVGGVRSWLNQILIPFELR